MAVESKDTDGEPPKEYRNTLTRSRTSRLREHLVAEVDPEKAILPLTCYCFMTGYIDAVCFTACFIWCAFQTGEFPPSRNTIQLAIAIARLFSVPRDTSFHIADRQALCSLLTFLLGAFLGRIGDHVGCRKRYWIVSATLLQAGFSLGAALTSHYGGQSSFANTRGDPSWNNVLGFCSIGFVSASLGLQANIGTRLGTQFATTVVLTTIWVQLMGDPKLFDVRHLVKTRDLKILAIVALIIGGFVSRALIDKIGASTTLGIGAAMRVLIALSWLFVPSKL